MAVADVEESCCRKPGLPEEYCCWTTESDLAEKDEPENNSRALHNRKRMMNWATCLAIVKLTRAEILREKQTTTIRLSRISQYCCCWIIRRPDEKIRKADSSRKIVIRMVETTCSGRLRSTAVRKRKTNRKVVRVLVNNAINSSYCSKCTNQPYSPGIPRS